MALSQEDFELDVEILKASLNHILSDIECPGSFLTSASFEPGINPGLEVFGAGPIGLPLSAEVAKK
jgi:hypothetical protein